MTHERRTTALGPRFCLLAVVLITAATSIVGLTAMAPSLDAVVGSRLDSIPLPHSQDAPPVLTETGYLSGVLGSISNRQNEIRPTGFVLSVRRSASGCITRGSFLLSGDIRSYYGEVSPHLLFCRLLN